MVQQILDRAKNLQQTATAAHRKNPFDTEINHAIQEDFYFSKTQSNKRKA
jgi:hypothetical protein